MHLRRLAFVAALFVVVGSAALVSSQTYTADDSKTVIVKGEVVRLEPGKTIVIRSGGQEVTYVLSPGLTVPTEVQTGRLVTLQTMPGPDGSTIVRQVTTTTTPTGETSRTTTTTTTSPTGDTRRTTTTETFTAKVDAYVPGKSVTVIDSRGKKVTYVLAGDASIPIETMMGKEVFVQVVPKEQASTMIYEIERDGDKIKIKARPRN